MRHILALFVFILVSGCQMGRPDDSSAGIEQRLAEIEASRLQTKDVPDVRKPRRNAIANRPVAIYDLNRDVLTMSDMDPPADPLIDESENTRPAGEQGAKSDRSGPLPSLWATIKRDVKAAPRDLWRDTKRVYANPVNLVILGTAYGGSMALQHGVDGHIENHFNDNDRDWQPAHNHFKEDWRDAFGAIGNPATHFALAGVWYLIGQQRLDDKTYEVGKTLFSALLINGVTVVVGQAASYDKSPNGEYGTFPSGHTSSSFVFASVMHEAYGHVVGVPLYALAALAGYERVEDGEHYFSDVAMGAVLGTVIGHSVASGRDPEFFGWKILPYASMQGGSGVAFVKSLE